MLQNERLKVAGDAVARMGSLLDFPADDVFADAIKHNFVLLLTAIDAVAAASNRPLLITTLLPGYDLVVARSEVKQHNDLLFKDGVDVRSLTAVDPSVLQSVALLLDDEFLGSGGGAITFESDDGVHYVAFRSSDRALALQSMGIESVQ